MHLYIWNDDAEQLTNWHAIAAAEGYAVSESSSHDVNAAVDKFFESMADLAILDVVMDGKPVGLQIAEGINSRDLLAPIILVTRYPDTAYENVKLDKYQLAGIYQHTIMGKVLLRRVAIRQAISSWHAVFPGYALVRRASNLIERNFASPELAQFSSKLRACMSRMPSSASVDAWHSLLAKVLAEQLKERGYPKIAESYRNIVSKFDRAEPFFMAARLGRRHLAHNVEVFLMGLILLLEDTPVREHAMRQVGELCGRHEASESLADALLIWGCAATTHDSAYLAQKMASVSSELATIVNGFKDAIAGLTGTSPSSVTSWDWPEMHHARIGGELWRNESGNWSGTEKKLLAPIVEAIEGHDSSMFPRGRGSKVGTESWALFLAIMCDELQDWGREPHEAVPGGVGRGTLPWRFFELASFRTERNVEGLEIRLKFVVFDYHVKLGEQNDRPGTEGVETRFGEILDVLESNLRSSLRTKIILSAEFLTRETPNASKSRVLER